VDYFTRHALDAGSFQAARHLGLMSTSQLPCTTFTPGTLVILEGPEVHSFKQNHYLAWVGPRCLEPGMGLHAWPARKDAVRAVLASKEGGAAS
jgi:hypothetical protein